MPNVRIALVQETSNHVYYSGSAITGNLLLDTDEPKNYKQISVHFNGKSYVHWTETRTEGSGDNQRTVTDSFTSSESYVDLISTVWSSQQSPDGKLAPGQYSWPFRFNIPPTAPSSFEGTVGHIRYNLIGRIGTGLLKLVEVQIPVQQLVRITDPRLLQPQRKEIQKTVCCMCCASQPIILTVAVPKTGFCIGESFQLHVSLENGSARRVFMMVNLTRKVTFFAEGNRTWRTKILLSIQSDRIEAHGIRNWDPTIEIPISDVPIVHDNYCSNIKVTYTLTIYCRIPRAFNLTIEFPLQFGNCREEVSGHTQQEASPQPTGVYPPPQFAPQQQPTAPYPLPGAVSGQPPTYQLPPPSTPIGWSIQPALDFPPHQKPQESLADFPVHEIKKQIH